MKTEFDYAKTLPTDTSIDLTLAEDDNSAEYDPRQAIYYLAEKIGIHRLYALVVQLRGEPDWDNLIHKDVLLNNKPEFLNPNVVRGSVIETLVDQSYATGWNACNETWIEYIHKLTTNVQEATVDERMNS